MRKALIVGINYYENGSLFGCVHDAYSLFNTLETNSDGSYNFQAKIIAVDNPNEALTCNELLKNIKELFEGDNDISLLYFAGHGSKDAIDGYLCTSECKTADDGLSLSTILKIVNKSKVRNKIILLDCCYSGFMGKTGDSSESVLETGLSILTASTENQYATEENGRGLFTGLLIDALNGAAADLLGNVTPGSIYSHIDKSLGAWEQRPVFKTNINQFVSLRRTSPSISLSEIQKLTKYFPQPGFIYQLDPSYEPEKRGRLKTDVKPNDHNNEIFETLQRYNRVNLLVPIGASSMWHAAMYSKSCQLTVLGEHYRRLVEKKLIY